MMASIWRSETLVMELHYPRHSREGGNPAGALAGNSSPESWIPAFAGMTKDRPSAIFQRANGRARYNCQCVVSTRIDVRNAVPRTNRKQRARRNQNGRPTSRERECQDV